MAELKHCEWMGNSRKQYMLTDSERDLINDIFDKRATVCLYDETWLEKDEDCAYQDAIDLSEDILSLLSCMGISDQEITTIRFNQQMPCPGAFEIDKINGKLWLHHQFV